MKIKKKGIFRIWVILFFVWFFSVMFMNDYKIMYAFRYNTTTKEQLISEDAKESCRFYAAEASYFEKKIINIDDCIKNFTPRKPDYSWIGMAILPPTVGLASIMIALLALIRAMLFVYRWVADGFK